MRIEAYTQVQQVYNTKKTAKIQQTAAKGAADKIQISSIGKDIQIAKNAVWSSSDIREELVTPLRASIKNGTYEVSGESFADKLLEQYEKSGF